MCIRWDVCFFLGRTRPQRLRLLFWLWVSLEVQVFRLFFHAASFGGCTCEHSRGCLQRLFAFYDVVLSPLLLAQGLAHSPADVSMIHVLQAPRRTPAAPAGGMFSGPARMMRRALEASGGCVPSGKDESPVRGGSTYSQGGTARCRSEALAGRRARRGWFRGQQGAVERLKHLFVSPYIACVWLYCMYTFPISDLCF